MNIEQEEWCILHGVGKEQLAKREEKKRIEKLKECPSTDEVRKFRVKLYYKLLSEDTLLAIINYMGRAKENGTYQKAKEELRFLNLKQETRYKFEYDLEVKLHCSTSETEIVQLQTEIVKRERMLWENLDKLSQKQLLERISALGRKVKTKEDISWDTLANERGRKIDGDAFEILASYMFKNDTTDKLILQLEENLTVKSLTDYIEHRSNEVYSLDDRCKTIVNLSKLEELNVLYQTACGSEKLAIEELIQKAKIEESRYNMLLRLTTKGNYDGYRDIEIEKVNDIKLRKAERELYRYEYFYEYGVYPPERFKGTANDIIYLWKNQDGAYKIGVTSKRAGRSRIWKVAREGHMQAEIIYYEEVEDAIVVEKQLLKCGTKVHFKYKFDGSTEFRYLSEEDLEEVTNIIKKYKVF